MANIFNIMHMMDANFKQQFGLMLQAPAILPDVNFGENTARLFSWHPLWHFPAGYVFTFACTAWWSASYLHAFGCI